MMHVSATGLGALISLLPAIALASAPSIPDTPWEMRCVRGFRHSTAAKARALTPLIGLTLPG